MISHVWLTALKGRNRYAKAPVLGSADALVSLTTYGSRLGTVAYVVESIAAGRRRPRRMILWLDDPDAYESRPESLRRLERRGLEVRLTQNYGPHTKYYPSLAGAIAEDLPIVTADDDILYPRYWLNRLLVAASAYPDVVSCYRASVVATIDAKMAPYTSWPRCKSTTASLAHFATGVSGVFYPMAMVHALAARGTEFISRCPRADDIWLHWVAIREGVLIRQIAPRARHFPYVPGTQEQTLVEENVHQGANDVRIAALYTESDVSCLSASVARLGGSSEPG